MFLRIAAELFAMAQASQPLPPPKTPNSHMMVGKITDAAATVLSLKRTLPDGIYAQLDPEKSIDENWKRLVMKSPNVEIIVLNAENQDNSGNTDTPNS